MTNEDVDPLYIGYQLVTLRLKGNVKCDML